MKRNAVAAICTTAIAVAILMTLGIQNAPVIGDMAETSSQAQPVAASESATPNDEPAADDAPSDVQVSQREAEASFEQGAILVGLQDNATAADLNALLPTLDYIATKQITDDDIAFGYARLALTDGVDVKDAENRLLAEDPNLIAAAQPNYVYHLLDDAAAARPALIAGIIAQATDINDAYADKQWALEAVRARDAWDTAKAGDADPAITVAVLDTGIDTDHEDFDGTRIVGALNTVKVYENDDDDTGKFETGKDGTSVEDGNGHGTHVAGIIAATSDNGKGVSGVSYNAGIMPVRVLGDSGSGNTIDIAKGLQHVYNSATANNVKVVNLSLSLEGAGEDAGMMSAIAKLHNKGILIVYAAGNSAIEERGAYVNFPVDYDADPGAIGVISAVQSGTTTARADYSNYNTSSQVTKELTAPGSNILSTTISGMADGSVTYLAGTKAYGYMNGTSMAAPCVSGIAALAFAANPGLSAGEVRNILCNTAQDINTTGWDRQTGYGLVDAAAATAAAKAGTNTGTPAAPSATTVTTTTSLAKATVTLSKAKYVYNGEARKPSVVVMLGGKQLVRGSDYTVSYSGNVKVGKGKVTVTGCGSYGGTVSKAFTIVPKGTSISKLTKLKKGFTAKWKKQAVQTGGYQLQYSLKKSFSSKKTITISKAKTVSKKVVKLKAKKKYYVRVRTFKKVGGVSYYSGWSAVKSVKTKG